MLTQLRNRNLYLLIVLDILLFAGSLSLAYGLRFAFTLPPDEAAQMMQALPLVLGLKALCFLMGGAYRGMWRFTSLPDLVRLGRSALLATLLIMVALTFATRFQGYPRSVFAADAIFTIFLCGGVRLTIRLLYAKKGGIGSPVTLKNGRKARRLILLGAGRAADMILREIHSHAESAWIPVACLDDDRAKHGRTLLGVPVRGAIGGLARWVEACRAEEVLIAMPSVSGKRMREIVDLCEKSGVPFKTIPSLSSLMNGQAAITDLRPVRLEDLLGRPPVRLKMDAIGKTLTGQVVAVTGAGGSIGSELCRQIARFKPASLILIEANEFNLYRIEMELRTIGTIDEIVPIMGRVQDQALIRRVLTMRRPRTLFHAAAYKHVPMVEMNPWEGVINNVTGSQSMMDLAEEAGVERFVLVSTDKAVRPTNVMGATKRMAEILLQSRPYRGTRFMAVRFGNVVGSSGSVVPLFQQQIRDGGPVTVTHPEVTRFFMTIPEACQLILQAGAMGEGGEIFVLEMGTPVKIADMARDLIRLSGKKPDEEIPIVYTGLRPGEKLYEELITQGEGCAPTPHEKIMVLRREKDGSREREKEALAGLNELLLATREFDCTLIRQTLQRLIPEYKPGETESVLTDLARPMIPFAGRTAVQETGGASDLIKWGPNVLPPGDVLRWLTRISQQRPA